MDWSTLVSAFIGGIAGSLVTGAIGYVSLRDQRDRRRRDRQMLDAEIIADADLLLMDVSPPRRGLSLAPTPGAEADLWAELRRRSTQVSRELGTLAAGHPDDAVRAAASDLSSAVIRATTQSQWHVRDLLANRDASLSLTNATAEHEAATATLARLREAIKAAGAPRRMLWPRRRTGTLPA
jgi:hypothetical protein